MKPITFQTFKRIKKMSLNEINRWASVVYQSGMQDGIDLTNEDIVAEISEDTLREILLSVKGIGPKRADEVMEKILKEDRKA